jgi:predicted dehydrogenase
VGVVLDLMIHDIDLSLSLAQSRVCKVDAVGINVTGNNEDIANARVEFENGCVANLSASRVASESTRRMRAWSARAWATVDFAARTAALVHPSETLLRGELRVKDLPPDQVEYCREHFAREHLPEKLMHFEAVDALALEVRDFVDAIRDSRQPLVTGEAGRDAVALAEQILESIRSHGNQSRIRRDEKREIGDWPILPLPQFSQDAAAQTTRRRNAG